MCVLGFSCVQLFVTLRAVAHQAPLSMELSRQEHWSELPFPSPGELPYPGIEPVSLMFPAFPGVFFTTRQPRKPYFLYTNFKFHSFELDFKSHCLPGWYLWASQVEINSLRLCWPHWSSFLLRCSEVSAGIPEAAIMLESGAAEENHFWEISCRKDLRAQGRVDGTTTLRISSQHMYQNHLSRSVSLVGFWIPTCFSCHWNWLYKEKRETGWQLEIIYNAYVKWMW